VTRWCGCALTFGEPVNLTGTKVSCGEGGCGSCTVMVSWFDRSASRIVYLFLSLYIHVGLYIFFFTILLFWLNKFTLQPVLLNGSTVCNYSNCIVTIHCVVPVHVLHMQRRLWKSDLGNFQKMCIWKGAWEWQNEWNKYLIMVSTLIYITLIHIQLDFRQYLNGAGFRKLRCKYDV